MITGHWAGNFVVSRIKSKSPSLLRSILGFIRRLEASWVFSKRLTVWPLGISNNFDHALMSFTLDVQFTIHIEKAQRHPTSVKVFSDLTSLKRGFYRKHLTLSMQVVSPTSHSNLSDQSWAWKTRKRRAQLESDWTALISECTFRTWRFGGLNQGWPSLALV